MVTVILFILILGLLVFVHEFGHFVVARRTGMKVYEFGLGFPPRALGVYRDPKTKKFVWVKSRGTRDEGRGTVTSTLKNTVGDGEGAEEFPATLYSLNWLPLGGFCKIKGENGDEANDPDSFGYQKAWKRIATLVAGVSMNFLLAGFLLGFGLMWGLPADLSEGVDSHAIIVEQPGVFIDQVVNDSPAQKAGLQFGDKVEKIDGVQMKSSSEMVSYINGKNGQELTIDIKRGQENISIRATPVVEKAGEPARIGALLSDAGVIRYPWFIALYKGFYAAGIGLINIFVAFYLLIKNLIIGQGLMFDVSGPVGIATVVGQSAKLGFNYLLNVTAMISLSLAAINILPIPALDGGRVLFVLIEKVFRRPVPMKYEQLAHTIGFALLMLLIVVVTFRDVVKLF